MVWLLPGTDSRLGFARPAHDDRRACTGIFENAGITPEYSAVQVASWLVDIDNVSTKSWRSDIVKLPAMRI